MFNDFKGFNEKGEAVKISVPPTLLISTIGVMSDSQKAVSIDAKFEGDSVYVLGETKDELVAAFQDLRNVGVDILTLGQYLRPSESHLPVQRYWHQSEFDELRDIGMQLGFLYIAAGPMVRSSYRAAEAFLHNHLKKKVREHHEKE